MLPILPVERSKAEARRSYDRLSSFYDIIAASEWPLIREGLAWLAPQMGEQILEIGYGTGRALPPIAEAVGERGRVLGVDISPRMRARAEAKLARRGLAARCQLEVGDAARWPFAPGAFAAAFMAFTLELFDIEEIPEVLARVKAALKAEGRLAVVSLSKSRGSTLPVRLYEALHRRFPATLDCRPIYVERSLLEAGLALERAKSRSLWGLPVEIVLATKPRK